MTLPSSLLLICRIKGYNCELDMPLYKRMATWNNVYKLHTPLLYCYMVSEIFLHINPCGPWSLFKEPLFFCNYVLLLLVRSYYWGFAAYVAYHINHSLYTPPSTNQVQWNLSTTLCTPHPLLTRYNETFKTVEYEDDINTIF